MQVIKINFKEEERHFIGVKESYGCNFCIAKNDNDLCSVLSNHHCSRDQLVFQEIKLETKAADKGYTIDQICSAWKETWNSDVPVEFKINLSKVSDPEYEEYKRLQSKFKV